jgi:hypothetical protein
MQFSKAFMLTSSKRCVTVASMKLMGVAATPCSIAFALINLFYWGGVFYANYFFVITFGRGWLLCANDIKIGNPEAAQFAYDRLQRCSSEFYHSSDADAAGPDRNL